MAVVITLTANPLLNHLSGRSLRPGAVNRVPPLRRNAEGKGVNVARVLQAHGHRVLVAAFAGGDSGARFGELLGDTGMEALLCPTAARLRIGFQAGSEDDRHPTTLIEDGFAVDEAECEVLLERLAGHLQAADLVIASGSVPDPRAQRLYVDLLAICAHHEVPCWIDAYGPAMHAALKAPCPPALAKPNREEYDAGGAWHRVDELHRSDGAGALSVLREGHTWRVRPPRVRQRNPIGSGDCYVAALAHARLAGWSWEAQLRYAAAAGAANAARADVAAITPDEIAGLAEAATVDVGATDI